MAQRCTARRGAGRCAARPCVRACRPAAARGVARGADGATPAPCVFLFPDVRVHAAPLARSRRATAAQELQTALGLPQGLLVRHARVDSLRVQARPARTAPCLSLSHRFPRFPFLTRHTKLRGAPLSPRAQPPHVPARSRPPQLPSLANYKTEPWVVHLGALEVAIQEVPFGAAGASADAVVFVSSLALLRGLFADAACVCVRCQRSAARRRGGGAGRGRRRRLRTHRKGTQHATHTLCALFIHVSCADVTRVCRSRMARPS